MTLTLRDEFATLTNLHDQLRDDAIAGFAMSAEGACLGAQAWYLEAPGDYTGAIAYVRSVDADTPLGRLYFPFETGMHWRIFTPEHAAQAIENYLATGEPDWRGILVRDEAITEEWLAKCAAVGPQYPRRDAGDLAR